VIVVDLPAALWVEKKGYFWLSQVFGGFFVFSLVWNCCSGIVGLASLAFPCVRVGLLASPLCGAAPTFLCSGKEK
jgi:hypothetical protein